MGPEYYSKCPKERLMTIALWRSHGEPLRSTIHLTDLSEVGKYGGPENPHRAAATHDWPYAKTNSSIANGINIAFWAKDNTLRGLFASPPYSLFNKKSAYLVMPLKDGQRKNFLSEGDATHKYLESAQVDFYATWNDS